MTDPLISELDDVFSATEHLLTQPDYERIGHGITIYEVRAVVREIDARLKKIEQALQEAGE